MALGKWGIRIFFPLKDDHGSRHGW
jgi:hypothetical protein